MKKESCDVGLQKDEKYVWKLKVKGDCKEVLDNIKKKLGQYGRRYFEDRLVFEAPEKTETSSEQPNTDEN